MVNATDKWYNLSEMARLTGINRAQLHKYVKTYSGRFNTKKVGRRTVFAESSVKEFEAIRAEGLRKVGKKVTPRAKAAGPVRKKAGRPAASVASKTTPSKKTVTKKNVKAAAAKKSGAKKTKVTQPKKAGVRGKAGASKRAGKSGGDATMAELLRAIKELRAEVANLRVEATRPVVLSMELKRK
jgi:hypothetical protein